MIWTLAVAPVFLLVLGFPIFLVLLSAVTLSLVFLMNMPMAVVQQTLFASVNAYTLLALPFFIFAGELMDRGGIASRLVTLVQASMGRVPGKLALTTIGTGAIFGAITGVGAASVATVGKVTFPALRKAKYTEEFSSGLLVSVGAVGVVLPPSIPMIIYGASAEQSIPRLYAAGIGPGLLILLLLSLYAIWASRKIQIDAEAFNLGRFFAAFKRGVWALGVPVLILGGIYGGVFSPTEAAAVACLYAIIVTVIVMRELDVQGVIDAARNTVVFTSQILIIVACAGVFSWIITVNQVPVSIVNWMEALNVAPWMLLLVINVLLLLIGCVLDPLSAILLLTPLLLPVTMAIGIDPIHFGMIVTVNLAIGLFTPPMGINLFVLQSIFGTKLSVAFRGALPFLAIYLVALMLVTFIPAISEFGVWLFMGE
ncbi:TRAP transporter large permease [Oceaniglobus ichthyenteri]|uniref:TRAP transporter large permease n=1 Tax=Oceaniglobus ichthyenteri TaxID=2136177 RepID=UPI000D34E6BB|nr:TRAP transporter large permease [Oceaniglobus ichthyenteri]